MLNADMHMQTDFSHLSKRLTQAEGTYMRTNDFPSQQYAVKHARTNRQLKWFIFIICIFYTPCAYHFSSCRKTPKILTTGCAAFMQSRTCA